MEQVRKLTLDPKKLEFHQGMNFIGFMMLVSKPKEMILGLFYKNANSAPSFIESDEPTDIANYFNDFWQY